MKFHKAEIVIMLLMCNIKGYNYVLAYGKDSG